MSRTRKWNHLNDKYSIFLCLKLNQRRVQLNFILMLQIVQEIAKIWFLWSVSRRDLWEAHELILKCQLNLVKSKKTRITTFETQFRSWQWLTTKFWLKIWNVYLLMTTMETWKTILLYVNRKWIKEWSLQNLQNKRRKDRIQLTRLKKETSQPICPLWWLSMIDKQSWERNSIVRKETRETKLNFKIRKHETRFLNEKSKMGLRLKWFNSKSMSFKWKT